MKRQRYGRVVLTSSGRALFAEYTLPELSGYAIGKMAQIGLMHALNANGAGFGILVNTIVPVAATRMLRRQVAPQEMRPEQVAPGVAFLASQECKVSGVILLANNGLFSTIRWQESSEINFGSEPASPEAIAEQWEKLKAFPDS